ncbi:hypothetical protein [Faecalibaculum rodentium]|uniref:hypothetical protein n=1 Tax=Faecalibaculum rodentium TaxID=1702221 RepID=UPI00266F40B9|nr:hypothetical protein [Faecalibaculum rodentium]
MNQSIGSSKQLEREEDTYSLLIAEKYPVNDVVIRFKTHYKLTVARKDDYLVSENNVFNTCNAGITEQELISDFIEDLFFAWKVYVDCSEDELSEHAKIFRSNLQKWITVDAL